MCGHLVAASDNMSIKYNHNRIDAFTMTAPIIDRLILWDISRNSNLYTWIVYIIRYQLSFDGSIFSTFMVDFMLLALCRQEELYVWQ